MGFLCLAEIVLSRCWGNSESWLQLVLTFLLPAGTVGLCDKYSYLDTELCFGKLVHSEKKRSMITSLTMYGVTKIQKQGSTPGRLSALRVPSLTDIKILDTELWVVQFEFTTEFFLR